MSGTFEGLLSTNSGLCMRQKKTQIYFSVSVLKLTCGNSTSLVKRGEVSVSKLKRKQMQHLPVPMHEEDKIAKKVKYFTTYY